jgi:hypothetical protein
MLEQLVCQAGLVLAGDRYCVEKKTVAGGMSDKLRVTLARSVREEISFPLFLWAKVFPVGA